MWQCEDFSWGLCHLRALLAEYSHVRGGILESAPENVVQAGHDKGGTGRHPEDVAQPQSEW